MSDLEKLFNELKNLKSSKSSIENSKDTWKLIGNRDFSGAGFNSEEEVKQWILDNPYSNLI